MQINYWDCPCADPDEYGEGADQEWLYRCTHPSGKGHCSLDNKYGNKKADCLLVDEGNLGWEAKLRAWRLQRCPLQTTYYLTITPNLGDKVLKDFVCDIFWGPELFCDAVEDLVKHGAYPDGSDIFFSWDREGKDVAVFHIPDFQPEARQFWAQVVIPELTKDGVTFYIHYGNKEITKSLARPKEVYRLARWTTVPHKDELEAI